MNYQIIAPPPSLERYVSHFWVLESKDEPRAQRTFTVMSNGRPGLIFLEKPEVFTGFEGERLPQFFVFGQATKAGQLGIDGSFCNIGVNFKPTALKSVFGLDANQLTHQNTSVGNLVKGSLAQRMLDCGSVQQKIACLSGFLQKQVRRHGGGNRKIDYALDALQQGKRLPQVLGDLQISERSLERLFLGHVGVTPVLYARICRFQTSMTLMRQGRYRSLTDIAHSLGYFDQSHFIRDFKLFAGVSPRSYLQKAVERMPGFPEWEE